MAPKSIAVISLGRKHVWSLFGKELAETLSDKARVSYIGSSNAEHRAGISDSLYISTGQNFFQNLVCSINPINKISILKFFHSQKPDWTIFPVRHPWLPILLPFLKGKKALVVHDVKRHLGEESWLDNWLDHNACLSADLLITLSHYCGSILKEMYPGKKILSLFHPICRYYIGLRGTIPPEPIPSHYILFFGRLITYKGLNILLEAWGELKNLDSELYLVLAGKGEELVKIPERAIMINREISDKELVYLIDKCKFVVAPYLEASQSGVIATSFAREKMVVATKVGGIPEQIENGKTGFLCKPEVGSLYETLITALNLAEREKEQIRNNIRLNQSKFSWENFATKLIEEL